MKNSEGAIKTLRERERETESACEFHRKPICGNHTNILSVRIRICHFLPIKSVCLCFSEWEQRLFHSEAVRMGTTTVVAVSSSSKFLLAHLYVITHISAELNFNKIATSQWPYVLSFFRDMSKFLPLFAYWYARCSYYICVILQCFDRPLEIPPSCTPQLVD